MNHVGPNVGDIFSTFGRLEKFLGRHDFAPERTLRYLIAHDVGAYLQAELRRPLEEGGLGERVVAHGSWVLPMGIARGREWTAGEPKRRGVSSAHLAARLVRDIDMFFPAAAELSPDEHANRGMTAIRRMVDESHDPANPSRVGLGGLVRYVPNPEDMYTDGITPPDAIFTARWPGQVWGNLLALPLDPDGNPIPGKAMKVPIDIHPPNKIPLLIGTVRPVRSGIPIRVPGFRSPSMTLELVPPAQQFVNKALLLTDSTEYDNYEHRVKGALDCYYLAKSMGPVSSELLQRTWNARWPEFHPDREAPTTFQILDVDVPEWGAAYEDWKRKDCGLRNYPDRHVLVSEISAFVDGMRAAPPGHQLDPARGVWHESNRSHGAARDPRRGRAGSENRYRAAPQRHERGINL